MAVDVASIIDEVLRKMRLSKTSPTAVARADVLSEINDMLKDLTEHSYVFIKKDDTAITLVSTTRSYALPSDCFELLRVYDADEKKIYPITIEQLEEMSRDWVDDSGEPEYFLMGYEASTYITFYPCPGSDEDTDKIGLQYRNYQTALTDSASSYLPGLIANNKQLAIDWCLGKLLLDKTEVQDQALAQTHLNGYYNERKKWESRPKAPEKTRIYGVRGEEYEGNRGPQLPSGYPFVRLW